MLFLHNSRIEFFLTDDAIASCMWMSVGQYLFYACK